MSIDLEKAKELVREDLKKMAYAEYPLVWVGELMKETDDEYFIEGNIYNEDEKNSNDESRPFAVHKTSGHVRMINPELR